MRPSSTALGGKVVRAAAVLSILTGLVAVTSCADGATSPRPRESAHGTTHQGTDAGEGIPPVAGIPVILGVKSLVLPIEPYLVTDRQMSAILRARQELVAPCMRRFGFAWPDRDPGTGTGTGDSGGMPPGMKNAANMDRRYGITDPALAARLGYHFAPDARQRTTEESSAARPDADALAVLTGRAADGTPAPGRHHGLAVPEGGCQGQATARLTGGLPLGNDPLASEINIVSYQKSRADPRVRAVFRAWSACMRKRGYSYAAPTDAPGKDPRFTGPTPTRQETALAEADVACKRQTNVIGVWFTVDTAYQRRMMASKGPELAHAKEAIRTRTANAERVLNGDR
ncbi:hypothetical protein [Streptomyces sp. 351MFTsu5.1]|uniref:hypothetical protein n=1 Tax=Streptomyces sp. 351MFTsu5.1 TaxID=1172180 RepID=UPI000382029D|nr:hypothetical protein [Streptomyces sp. 351MFTsu5.1]